MNISSETDRIKSIEPFLKEAENYLSQGDFDRAISLYQQLTQKYPQCWQAYQAWGDLLFDLKRWSETITVYRQAISINPNLDRSHYNLGEALAQLSRWKEAIVAYQQALHLNANLPHIYRKLGDALQQRATADKEAMLSSYLQAIEADPDRIQNYYQAIELQSQDVKLYLGLGNALHRQGRLDEAIVAYQMGLQLEPEHLEITQQLNLIVKFTQTTQNNIQVQNTMALASSQASKLLIAKQVLDNLNQITLDNFLLSDAQINLAEIEHPQVSIILILYNRAELTLSCLHSILSNSFTSIEVVIVDNNSSDRTPILLERVKGAKIIQNQENKHFLLACNQAAQVATGDYLLFLNNDARILGNSIAAAVKTIETSSEIGAVGGKIILPDGTLQEAGSIIWQDGSCLGYGRGDSPDASQYMYQRSVDYCSGAFLLTSRALFQELGGFDRVYQPAYYEETDYCVRLLKRGKQIIYDPNVCILHYEFASSTSSDRAIELQKRNHQVFISRHRDWLRSQYPADLKNILLARHTKNDRQRILFIDDRIPHPYLGSGYTRSHVILSTIVELGYDVTFYPTDLSYQEEWQDIYTDISRKVELATGYGLQRLEEFLSSRKGYYHTIFVSRPHNMNHLNYIFSKNKLLKQGKIIYDAEALYCLREIEQKRLKDENISLELIQKSIEAELKLARHSDLIISVSESEKQHFLNYGYKNVSAIGHSLTVSPTPNSYQQRQGILFVGAVYLLDSPNGDSIIWLSEEIFPMIQQQLEQEISLFIAGINTVAEIKQRVKKIDNPAIEMLGKVNDLTSLYNRAKMFVAPTRFAAGIPHKVHEAAAHGIPVVTTSLIANQLGWQDESDLLVADNSLDFARQCIRLDRDRDLWQTLRNNALRRVEKECSPEYFQQTLMSILNSEITEINSYTNSP